MPLGCGKAESWIGCFHTVNRCLPHSITFNSLRAPLRLFEQPQAQILEAHFDRILAVADVVDL